MDVESRLMSFLSARLPCRVAADVPSPRPLELVTVELTDEHRENVAVARAMVAVQAWAGTRSRAKDLAREADAALCDPARTDTFACEPDVFRVERQSLANFPAQKGEPRYQAVYSMAVDAR